VIQPLDSGVAITGMGAVSAFGEGAECLWQGLREGQSGIRPLRHARADKMRIRVAAQVPETFDPARHCSERTLPLLDRCSQLALAAANEAVAQSGLDFSAGDLALRTGVIIGTGVGGETTHDEQSRLIYEEHTGRVHPFTIVRLMVNAPARSVSRTACMGRRLPWPVPAPRPIMLWPRRRR